MNMMKLLRTSQNIFKCSKILRFSSQTNAQIINEYRKNWTLYDFRNPQFRYQLATSMNNIKSQKLENPNKVFTKENSTTVKNILSTVKQDQDLGEVIPIIQKLILDVEISFDEEWSSFNRNKYVQDLHSNEAFPILLKNLEKEIDQIDDYQVFCSLFHVLGNFHVSLKSPVMSKMYVKIMEYAAIIDLDSLVLFIQGLNKSIGYTGIYYDMISIISSRPFQKILSKLESIIDEATSPKDILQISLLLRFISPIQPDKKFNQFLTKCNHLTDEGILDPSKANSPEELQDILDCYLQITGLGHQFPNNAIPCNYVNELTTFLDHLGPSRSIILARRIYHQGYPAETFNRLLNHLEKLADTSESTVFMKSVARFFSMYGIQNKSLGLMEKQVEEQLETYAESELAYESYGRLYQILSRSQEKDCDQKRNQLLDDFLSKFQNDIGNLTLFTKIFYLQTKTKVQDHSRDSLPSDFEEKLLAIFLNNIKNNPVPKLKFFAYQMDFLLTRQLKKLPEWLIEKFIDLIPRMSTTMLKSYKPHYKLKPILKKKYTRVFVSKLLHLIEKEAKIMKYGEFLELLQMFIVWSPFFTKEDMKIIEKSGFLKLAKHYGSTSTILNNRIGIVLCKSVKTRSDLTLIQSCIDNILKSENNVHSNILCPISEAFFAVKSEIDEEKAEEFLSLLSSSLLRDFEYLTAPKIIKLATFLARYRYLPYEMVERIFVPEFLDNAEKMTYFGNDTPKITFHYKLMKLNQIICATYPEYNLPWHYEDFCVYFHDKLHFEKLNRLTDYHVYNALGRLVGVNRHDSHLFIKENVSSPLWNNINYELCFDKSTKKFCPVKVLRYENSDSIIDHFKSNIEASPRHIQHVAVRIFHPDTRSYSIINGKKKLSEYRELDSHCLKCEGYKVIDLNPDEFLAMSLKGKAVSYLSELIK